MTGFWLVSYIVLWLLVMVLGLLTVGLLQQIGFLQQRLGQLGSEANGRVESNLPAMENDGPDFGSGLPQLAVDTINGFGPLTDIIKSNKGYTLLMFLSPLCETCQYLVEPLNKWVKERANEGRVIAIMRADEQACRAFLSLFPLRSPVVCDSERMITMSFHVHHTPFGLLYDTHGALIRKGIVQRQEDLLTLLGDTFKPQTTNAQIVSDLLV